MLNRTVVTALACGSFALGVSAAFVESGGGGGRGGEAVAAPAKRAPAPAPLPACVADRGAAKPPSRALLDAFGVLRRDRTPADELPREALDALKARGFAPVDASSARLLRATADGGKAWVVPVPDVRTSPLRCFGVPPARGRPGLVLPSSPAPRAGDEPLEGLAVVAIGGAPAGAGGTLADLVRGRAPVAVEPCAGPDRDMLGVSGLVPDGVDAVHLTAPDGTAVRADVWDNGFSFVVAHATPRERGVRYVVWTGGDGTPHVQPVIELAGIRCGRLPEGLPDLPIVTPGPFSGVCAAPRVAALPPMIRPPRRGRGLRGPAAIPLRACFAPELAVPLPAPPPRRP